jgi:hypothetical protein
MAVVAAAELISNIIQLVEDWAAQAAAVMALKEETQAH